MLLDFTKTKSFWLHLSSVARKTTANIGFCATGADGFALSIFLYLGISLVRRFSIEDFCKPTNQFS